MELNPLERHE